ncbi:MAG: 2-oxo-4-hydroxy-4-carboxy-5-ureidoimidazoline decarboxylase, partial [Gammaproteobacteria bacterium]
AWRSDNISGQETVEDMAELLAMQVNEASKQLRLDLIIAHPDLAGRAAQTGSLTEESTSEQAGAGIGQCNAEQFSRFVSYNDAYKTKYGFPFVMAVKGSNRHLILAAFEERLEHDNETEFDRAISEIHKIAHFRLEALADKAQSGLFHSLKRGEP